MPLAATVKVADPPTLADWLVGWVVMAGAVPAEPLATSRVTSSTRNEVYRLAFSWPSKWIRMVCPA